MPWYASSSQRMASASSQSLPCGLANYVTVRAGQREAHRRRAVGAGKLAGARADAVVIGVDEHGERTAPSPSASRKA